MAMTAQILKKLQLLQALIEREEMGDEVIEMTVSKLLSYELENCGDVSGRSRKN